MWPGQASSEEEGDGEADTEEAGDEDRTDADGGGRSSNCLLRSLHRIVFLSLKIFEIQHMYIDIERDDRKKVESIKP